MSSLYSENHFSPLVTARNPGNEFEEISYFAPAYWQGHLRLIRLYSLRFARLVEVGVDTSTFAHLSNELLVRYGNALDQLRARFPRKSKGPAFLRGTY